VVSKTQKASVVSATMVLFHLMTRCRGVRSSKGGLGKFCTFNLGFAAISFGLTISAKDGKDSVDTNDC